jgi:hypothetical protein
MCGSALVWVSVLAVVVTVVASRPAGMSRVRKVM